MLGQWIHEEEIKEILSGAQMTKNSFNNFFNNKIRPLFLECNWCEDTF